MENTFWIWYPGDFELYHAMKQNFSRVERGFGWPAFWKSEGFRNRVAFRRTYELEQETSFTVFSNAIGHVLVTRENGEKKYPFGKKITVAPGKVRISIHAGCVEAFPCAYVQGEVIHSDKTWKAEDYSQPLVPVGVCKYFTKPGQNPTVWEYTEKECKPVKISEINGGVLAEFETELTAAVYVKSKRSNCVDSTSEDEDLEVFCGESEDEALDLEHCYYSWQPNPVTNRCPCCAVRFAFIPNCKAEDVEITAFYQYVDFPKRASFKCNDEKLNKIWEVAEHTFRLCSGIFFLDGVKRDKWIWSGDAYQSFFVNQYLLADPDIDQRTLLALRGNDPMTRHINTIPHNMYLSLSNRQCTIKAVEKLSMRFYHKFFSADSSKFQPHEILRQEIDRACSPGMAETFSKAVAVHIVLSFYWCLRVKLFPEGNCTAVQHTAPVIANLI